jgi:hypothetical protein
VKPIATRVTDDTADRLDDLQRDDESRSETIRRLLRDRTDPETEAVVLPAETVDAVRDRKRPDETFDDAVRRLLAAGVDDADRPPGLYVTRTGAAVLLGATLYLAANGSITATAGRLGLALAGAAVLWAGLRNAGWVG